MLSAGTLNSLSFRVLIRAEKIEANFPLILAVEHDKTRSVDISEGCFAALYTVGSNEDELAKRSVKQTISHLLTCQARS